MATSKLRLSMSISPKPQVLVVGSAGGVAENIALKLINLGLGPTTVLDCSPFSPLLLDAEQSKDAKVFCGDINREVMSRKERRLASLEELASNRILIAVEDVGDESTWTSLGLTDEDKKKRSSLLSKVSKSLPNSVVSVIYITDTDSDSNKLDFGQIFGVSGASAVRKWCDENNKGFSLLKYGKLIGNVPGKEPLPFVGLPLLEPKLHPSYTLQSVVLSSLSSGNKYASSELCTREVLSETAVRLAVLNTPLQAQVQSIAGSPPTDKLWTQMFSRLTSSSDVELLRIDFGAILKPAAFINWLVDSWFPQALIDADAATVLAGARPVRAIKASDNLVRIQWEDVGPGLVVRQAGEHEIRITTTGTPALSVVRLSKGALPGEAQLVERLLEEVNKSVYKKQFCVPAEQ